MTETGQPQHMAARHRLDRVIPGRALIVLLLASLFLLTTSVQATPLVAGFFKSRKIHLDEHVVFFPAQAWMDKSQRYWHVEIHGWIFEVNLARQIRNLGRRFFFSEKTDHKKEFKRLMRQRMHWFFVDSERNKIISIRLMGKTWELKKSGPNGHFYGHLKIPVAEAKRWRRDKFNRVHFSAVMQPKDTRRFSGTIEFVSPVGISIISDVDDTIKKSDVHNKRQLLRNTFVHPYKAIPGMAASYQRWARNRRISFHYLTASPWQLYVPLSRFLASHGFPSGSFHMKYFRFKDRTFFNLFKSSVKYKTDVIEKLLRRYPHRRFVLIGDSGEHDLDVYTTIASRHPKRVRAIFIHETRPRPVTPDRYKPEVIRRMRCPIIVFRTHRRSADLEYYRGHGK